MVREFTRSSVSRRKRWSGVIHRPVFYDVDAGVLVDDVVLAALLELLLEVLELLSEDVLVLRLSVR